MLPVDLAGLRRGLARYEREKSLAFRAVPLECLQAKKDVGGF
jgi:hypothetical protein